jgi:hypothetical protein
LHSTQASMRFSMLAYILCSSSPSLLQNCNPQGSICVFCKLKSLIVSYSNEINQNFLCALPLLLTIWGKKNCQFWNLYEINFGLLSEWMSIVTKFLNPSWNLYAINFGLLSEWMSIVTKFLNPSWNLYAINFGLLSEWMSIVNFWTHFGICMR